MRQLSRWAMQKPSWKVIRTVAPLPSGISAPANQVLRKKPYKCPTRTGSTTAPVCSSVVMREFDPEKILQGGSALQNGSSNYWQKGSDAGTGYGLDQWAVDEGHIDVRGFNSNPDSQCNAGGANVTDPRNGPTTRTWEFVGRKSLAYVSDLASDPQLNNNPAPFLWSATLFLGWAGGNGPSDCEPLLRAFPTEGREQQAPSCVAHRVGSNAVVCRYGTFATFGFNDTFPRLLKAQAGDIVSP
jgi:hypothetical protein